MPRSIFAGEIAFFIIAALHRTYDSSHLIHVLMQSDPIEENCIQTAAAHLEAGDYQRARIALERLLSSQPRDIEASLLLAKGAEANGEIELAERVLSDALQNAPQDARLLHALSRVHVQSGRLDEARAAAEQAASAAPLSLEYQRNLADIASAAGCVREALGRYGRLLTQISGSADALLYTKTAMLALEAGEEGLAGRVLAQAAAADPALVTRLIREGERPGYLTGREEQSFASPLFPMLEHAVLRCFLNLSSVSTGRPVRRVGLIGENPRSSFHGLETERAAATSEDASLFDLLAVCASGLGKEEEISERLRVRAGIKVPVLRLSMVSRLAVAAAQTLNCRRIVDPVYSTEEFALLALLTTLTPAGGCVLECGHGGQALSPLIGALLREHPDFRQVFVLPERQEEANDLAALRLNQLVGIVEYEYGPLRDGLERLWKKNRKVSLAVLHYKTCKELLEVLAEIEPRLERGGAVIVRVPAPAQPRLEAGEHAGLLLRPLDDSTFIAWKDRGFIPSHFRGGGNG